jgi:hypothetical protein
MEISLTWDKRFLSGIRSKVSIIRILSFIIEPTTFNFNGVSSMKIFPVGTVEVQ